MTANEVVDKLMYATQHVALFRYVDSSGTPGGFIRLLNPGDLIGTVDNYLIRSNVIWWGFFEPASGKMYFVRHDKTKLKITNAGSGTSIPLDVPTANDKIGALIGKAFKPIAKYGLIALLGTVVIKQGFNYLSSSKKD